MDDEALAAAAAFGLSAEQAADMRQQEKEAEKKAVYAVWPENWRPLLLAIAMQTQIRTTMKGAIGFDYTALPVVEQRIGLPAPEDQEGLADEFHAFRQIETIYFSSR